MTLPPPPRDPIAIARRLRDEGNISGAMQMLERASRIPTHRTASLLELGALLIAIGEFEQALYPYKDVLKTDPENLIARLGMADAYLSLAQVDEARGIYRTLAEEKPNDADIQLGLGECALHAGDFDTAFEALSTAVRSRPGDAAIQFNLAQVLQKRGELEDSERLYRAVINTLERDPASATVWNKLGSLLCEKDDWSAAREAFQKSVAILPDFPAGLNNLGEVCRELGDLDKAETSFDRACAIEPNYLPARYNRSLLRLAIGRYDDAWPDYELRWQVPPLIDDPRNPKPPLWNGEDLSGKSILIHAEQGIGDTIQFMRFLPELVSIGAEVLFAIQPRLAHLASTISGIKIHPLADLDSLAADYHCPLMSLAGRLSITPESIPGPTLIPEAGTEQRARWKNRLTHPGMKIGICWQGNPNAAADRRRSPPLRAFLPFSRFPGNSLISLQKTDGLEQLDELGGAVDIIQNGNDFDAGPIAFCDTIAILEQVDLVITGDTAITHLAASMGKPTWVALKHVPDWRWGLNGQSCEWYPTATLFRQASPGDWASVFNDMADRMGRQIG